MGLSPYDPLYRSGFDSYPEDYGPDGKLTPEGRAAREYTDAYLEQSTDIQSARAYQRLLESEKKCSASSLARNTVPERSESIPAPSSSEATPRLESSTGGDPMKNPELRVYSFRKPLSGKDSGEVIHLRDGVVAVDLGDVVVKVQTADFWDHVKGELEELVVGKEYVLNHPLEGAEFWTPIWEESSWEGPVIVVQDRDKNLKRITLAEFWEYVRFVPQEDDFDSKAWINKIYLFAEPLEGSRDYLWAGDTATPQGLALVSYTTAHARRKPPEITRGRFLRAVKANQRLPAPLDEVLDAWLASYPALRGVTIVGGGEVVATKGKGSMVNLARAHTEALLLRIEKTAPPEKVEEAPAKVVETPAKVVVRDHSTSSSYYGGDRAYDSNHYESPGQNPGSGGSGVGNDWDMCR